MGINPTDAHTNHSWKKTDKVPLAKSTYIKLGTGPTSTCEVIIVEARGLIFARCRK